MKGLLQRLEEGPVLGDGGYLMALRLRGFLQAGSMTPEVVATHPQEVRRLTAEFRDAGAEVLQTLTFFGTTNMLDGAGFGDRAEEINRTACRIAREAASAGALVAGNLNSPSIVEGDYDPADESRRRRTRDWLEEQLPWICGEGVDFLILETFEWLDEALVGPVEVARQTEHTLVVTVSFADEGRLTRDGAGPAECAKRLADAGAHVVGVNCLWPPARQLECARQMRAAVDVPVCCQPSAWHSWWSSPGAAGPETFARFAGRAPPPPASATSAPAAAPAPGTSAPWREPWAREEAGDDRGREGGAGDRRLRLHHPRVGADAAADGGDAAGPDPLRAGGRHRSPPPGRGPARGQPAHPGPRLLAGHRPPPDPARPRALPRPRPGPGQPQRPHRAARGRRAGPAQRHPRRHAEPARAGHAEHGVDARRLHRGDRRHAGDPGDPSQRPRGAAPRGWS